MMFSPKVEGAMNEQIKRELDSAYIYASMAAYFDRVGLPGAAHWMKSQFSEEQAHAWKFYGFIYDRGGSVTFEALDRPPADYASPLDAFEQTLAHEKKITAHIDDLYTLAVAEKDYASQVLLQWYIEEQVEEEKNATDIVARLQRIAGNDHALYMLDRELGQRA
jgi:ferritin